jgi:hypothetical protein
MGLAEYLSQVLYQASGPSAVPYSHAAKRVLEEQLLELQQVRVRCCCATAAACVAGHTRCSGYLHRSPLLSLPFCQVFPALAIRASEYHANDGR